VPQLSFTTDVDMSDDVTYCVRVTKIAGLAKAAYYGARLIKLLRELPPPPA
jgi:hypothetical protein